MSHVGHIQLQNAADVMVQWLSSVEASHCLLPWELMAASSANTVSVLYVIFVIFMHC